jgi:cardiolipin synthase C
MNNKVKTILKPDTRKLSTGLMLIFTCFTLEGCRLRPPSRLGPQQGAEAGPLPTVSPSPSVVPTPSTSPTPTAINSYFNIFNPSWQVDGYHLLTAAQTLQTFPIHTNDGSEVATLMDGAARYGMRIQLIDQAKISLRVQAFILTADESGYTIADHLIAAQKRGVLVKVIVDPIINGKLDDHKMYFYLLRNGIKVQGYEFLYANFIAGLSQQRTFGDTWMDANMRYHEKFFIADAESTNDARAIIGGANMANEYFYVEKENPIKMWRDQDVIVRGPIVSDTARIFDRTYQEFINEKIAKQMVDFDQYALLFNLPFFKGIGGLSKPNQTLVGRLNIAQATATNLNWKPALLRLIQSRPRYKEDLIAPIYFDMIEQSKSTIDIVNAYFVPDVSTVAALVRAVARGVKVRIITNHVMAQEIENLGNVSRASYKALMSANTSNPGAGKLEIFEWGSHKVLNNGEGQNHAKFAVFDQRAAIVGSFNIDPRSRFLNAESVVAFDHPDAVRDLNTIIQSYLDPKLTIPVTQALADQYSDPNGPNSKLSQQLWNLFTQYL